MPQTPVLCSAVDPTARGPISLVCPEQLSPNPNNPRNHTRAQIRAIAKSIETFGFNAPILADKDGCILAGHGRVEAAKLLGLTKVPIIFLHHLSDAEARAYMLADNKLTDRSSWNEATLAVQLKELTDLALTFDIEATGFELPEIDFRIQSLEPIDTVDGSDDFKLASGRPTCSLGEIWQLGEHRILCGNALDDLSGLFGTEKATAAFTDPPYNVRIDGHVSGKGAVQHREFPMATGEMSKAEFASFLASAVSSICRHTIPGALIYTCMDWRHMSEILAAGQSSGCELLNVCVWVKSNGGMGSLYRSRHELCFVYRNGAEPHLNNVQLGRFGRNRTNVWNYPGGNAFARRGSLRNLEHHPTVKPILMVADAIQDSSNRNDLVFDPFLGSGTTLLAAERINRRCFAVELDPLYVDTTINRWQRMTGRKAHNQLGESFAVIKSRRSNVND
ncbi:ParB N-terminal domain-containing protein [Bradyrhizobium sp. AUGA SZCCT0222]|uniref:site-specific DNA-methyltransferase n=1 Tax=Bradyrhizobium sp. AUGA SZCCT0222 TaxID=2807668 RepID=UPI001BA6E06F|nr:DNA methyltransferase [Bradyrhizobium sp. AUGA SZCCT0222]MBR1270310.1 ParB N-terminal domain-containing protein [Bradyrhizobium sp. AUGA SZCCT0222]